MIFLKIYKYDNLDMPPFLNLKMYKKRTLIYIDNLNAYTEFQSFIFKILSLSLYI